MSRKKKRLQRKGRRFRPTGPPRFTVGTPIRVKHGVTDPDFPDIPLGGWAGHVTEVDRQSSPPLYLVAWNRRTLDHMHPVFCRRCQRDDLEVERMWLDEDDLEPDTGEPMLTEQPEQLVMLPLRTHDQDDRIRSALGLTSDDPLPEVDEPSLRSYHAHLARHLVLPFPARCEEETGPFESRRHRITVTALLDPGEGTEDAGLLCEAVEGEEQVVVPLASVEVVSAGRNRQLVEDYSYWFWNWNGPSSTFAGSPGGLTGSDVFSGRSVSLKSLLATLLLAILAGAFYGGTMGAALAALDEAALAAKVGAALVGIVVGLFGAFYGTLFGAANRFRRGYWLGGVVGAVFGAAIGGLLGTMLVAFRGAIVGGLAGWALGKIIRWKFNKPLAAFLGLLAGAMLGVGTETWMRGAEGTWFGTWAGCVTGAIGGPVLLFAFGLALSFFERSRQRAN